jgi:puromycin-sensitive aminopeptidase
VPTIDLSSLDMVSVDPFRLPHHSRPRHYTLELSPDLDQGVFDGQVTIDVEVLEPTSEFLLNAHELEIHSVTVNGAETRFRPDDATERLVVTLDHEYAPGRARLAIAFSGVLNDKLRGFYRSTYHDADGQQRVIATTQMQPTDCRRAFPCWDEPEFKATFEVSLVVSDGLMAVSNGREVAKTMLDDGRVRIDFATTMAMSTYLVAFVVGPLAATDWVDVDGVPLRIVHVPGKEHLTEFGLDVAAFGLAWFQHYYGIPYPSDKVELLALPDFAAGAMENLGCITFRENLLLVDPATATQVERQLVADVVTHELAHMWFGDLVTMRWWNGIWLNEAFATFMEVAACDAFRPAWQRWTSFGLERSAAFEVDALASTRPVEFEVRSPADSEGMFDVLTYQKGGALLRMLEQYLGAEAFRRGVSDYLQRHAYGSTETSDLWDALEESTGIPVRRLMDSWIWQPGFPLVHASLEGAVLTLRQERACVSPIDDNTRWVVPVHVRDGEGHEQVVVLDGDDVTVSLGAGSAGPVVVNARGVGFYRVAYDETLRRRLRGDALRGLDTLERYHLVDDAWSAVLAGRLTPVDYLDVVEGFSAERDLAVWQAISMGITGCGRLVEGDAGAALARRVAALTVPALRELSWAPAVGESELTSKLRGLLVTLSALHGRHPESQEQAVALWQRSRSPRGALHPELVAACTTVAAALGGDEVYDAMLEGFRRGDTPQDQLRHLYALAEPDDAELLRRTCELAFSGEVKTQNAPFLLNRCIANRHHGAMAWDMVRERWSDANDRFPVNTIVRMVDPVRLLTDEVSAVEVPAFFAQNPIPQSAATLAQILERQQVNVRLRQREADNLARWLRRSDV